jgi:trimeric autotransporter adhesin
MNKSPAALMLALLPHLLSAAYLEGRWDERFDALGLNGPVNSIALHGRYVYVGGEFTRAGSIEATNIARWDGTNWAALAGEPLKEIVETVAANETGIYLTTLRSGWSAGTNRLLQWKRTNWMDLGTSGLVRALAVRGDDLIVAGNFAVGFGINVTIARWDGNNWWPWEGGMPGTNGILSLAVVGSKVYAGWEWHRPGMDITGIVAKWDGSWSFLPPVELNSCAQLAASGTRVFAGGFYLGGPVAQWNGTNWTTILESFHTSCDPPPCWFLNAMIMSGDDLYAGGWGLNYSTRGGFIKWDGTRWSQSGFVYGGKVHALASNGSELFVGGSFTNAGAKAARNFSIWHIPHRVEIVRSTNQLTLSWPGTGTNFVLEATGNLGQTNWSEVSDPVVLHDEKCLVTEPVVSTNRFYRLRRKPW